MHCGRTANPADEFAKQIKAISSKKKKVEADFERMSRLEFEAGMYVDEAGPILPGANLESSIQIAARSEKSGKLASAAVFVDQDAPLEYDGPRDVDELFADEKHKLVCNVRVQNARIVRTRPYFPEWKAVVVVSYDDDQINKKQLDNWLNIAGRNVGVGDWRPRHGRFDVTVIE